MENTTLPWQETYQSEYDIHVNERNPYYEYPAGFTFLRLRGIYSKEDDYIIDPTTGEATFIFDAGGSPTGIGLNYQPPFSGNFIPIDQPLFVCCSNFIGARVMSMHPKKLTTPIKESYLKVFPNPNDGQQIVLKYKFSNSKQKLIQAELINSAGVRVLQRNFSTSYPGFETTSTLDLQQAKLGAGIYFLRVTNGSEVQTSKIIISK